MVYFWSIFPNLGQENFFRKSSSDTISYGFLAPCQNSKKIMIPSQENEQIGQMEGHPITLLATTGGPKKDLILQATLIS